MTERKLRIGPWGRAAGVALVVAAWLACSNRLSPPGGTPTDTVDWNVPSATREMANLNFALKDVAGGEFRLADLKGHPVLLNFWATWCVPCKTEIPGFIDLYNRYRKRGLEVVGIDVDETASLVVPYARTMKMNYTVLLDGGNHEVHEAYGVQGLPTTIIIGRDGMTCEQHVGFTRRTTFEDAIKRLL